MKKQTFGEFLQEIHANKYMGTDDSMFDNYETWIVNLDFSEIVALANEWGIKIKNLVIEKIDDLNVGGQFDGIIERIKNEI